MFPFNSSKRFLSHQAITGVLLYALGGTSHPAMAVGGVLGGEFSVTGVVGVTVGRLSVLTLKGSRALLMM